MIYESSYWKDDLLKLSSKLEKRYRQKRWSERSLATVEKEVFIGFYIVRKLIESKQVSDSVSGSTLKLIRYPIRNTHMNYLLQDYWERIYNLQKGVPANLSLKNLCNQFIHSYIFSPFVPFDKSLLGFFVCSDYHRNRQIYYITLNRVVDVFRSVGNDYPSSSRVTYNEETGDYDVVLA